MPQPQRKNVSSNSLPVLPTTATTECRILDRQQKTVLTCALATTGFHVNNRITYPGAIPT